AGSDEVEFDIYAWNVAQGRGYRGPSPDVTDQDHLTAYRVPAPSLMWAGLYLLFGHRYDVVRVTHMMIGSLACLLVYGIGRRCFDERVGMLAAAAYAVYPTGLFYSTQLLSEPLAALLLLWFLLAALQFAENDSLRRALVAGLLLGMAILSRANAAI